MPEAAQARITPRPLHHEEGRTLPPHCYVDESGRSRALAHLTRVEALTAIVSLQRRLARAEGRLAHMTHPEALTAIGSLQLRLARAEGRDELAVIDIAGMRLDLAARVISYDGRRARLGRWETALLRCLARAGGAVVSRTTLTAALWPDGAPKTSNNLLEIYVGRARPALVAIDAPVRVVTIHGAGYRLAPIDEV